MQEITLYADRGNAEAIGDMLMEAGASSYTTQDADADTPSESPLFGEPGLEPKVQAWNRSLLTVLADDGFDWKTSLAVIEKALGIEKLEVKSVEAVPDVDWVRITQAQFQPIQASRRLWIVPSWSEPPSPDALNMKLDPGVAFGTGSHPTTHLCIQWLDENLKKGETVLDYGCGTGILAIAAAMFGAGSVEGCDIDPLAVEASRFNAENNGGRKRNQRIAEDVGDDDIIRLPGRNPVRKAEASRFNAENNGVTGNFCLPDGIPAGKPYDIVIANILCNPLISLSPTLCGHVAEGGQLVLSGILDDQVDRIIEAFHKADPAITLSRWRSEEGWNVLSARRAASL